MKIVIVGAGFTGVQLAKLLINEKNDVIVIENNEEIARHVSNQLDCNVIVANGNSLDTLEEAGIAKSDALVCVTESDEINMITCSLVDAVYPEILKIARVRNYEYYVNTAAAKKSHSNTFKGKHRPLYGIDYMIHPDVEAADAIVQAVENGAISNIVTFDNSQMQITRIPVTENSVFASHKLMELKKLTSINMLVCYVEIDGKTTLADGNTIMVPGCTLGIITSKEDISEILKLAGSKQKELKKIALIGAGRIGTIIASKIIEPKKHSVIKLFGNKNLRHSQDVIIIDNDEQLAKNASERFPDARVYRADATEESFLVEEGITSFDLAICATHNHEMNMVLAAYLESLGVKQTISLVTSSAFASIAEKLGVDVPIPLRDVIVDSIMSHLRGNVVKEIHTITNGELEIIECVLPSESKINGKTVKEIVTPEKFLILLDKHPGKDEYEIANGNTILSTGDHLVLITQAEFSQKVLEFFGNTID